MRFRFNLEGQIMNVKYDLYVFKSLDENIRKKIQTCIRQFSETRIAIMLHKTIVFNEFSFF